VGCLALEVGHCVSTGKKGKRLKLKTILTTFLIVLFAFAATGSAAYIAVDSGNYTGSRSSATDGGIFATGQWADGGITLSWDIAEAGGLFTYVYTFGGTAIDEKDLSHWLLEVSDTFTADNILDGSDASLVDPTTYNSGGPGASNPGLPGAIYAVKFDSGTEGGNFTYTIVTDRAPMWGSFYAKDGVVGGPPPGGQADVYAYNTGFGTYPIEGATDFLAWIAVPNTLGTPPGDDPVIPEPGTLALFGTGLLGLGFWRHRRQRRS
jgi:hypothetical protein